MFLLFILPIYSQNGTSYVPDSATIQIQQQLLRKRALAFVEWSDSYRIDPPVTKYGINGFGRVEAFDFSPDGRYVAAVYTSESVILWEVSTQRVVREYPYKSTGKMIRFSPDGRHLFFQGTSELLMINVGNGLKEHSFGRKRYFKDISFSPDGERFVSFSSSGKFSVWNIKKNSRNSRKPDMDVSVHSEELNSVLFSNDGHFIISGSEDKTVKLSDSHTGSEICRIDAGGMVSALAISPDDRYIAAGVFPNQIKIWDLETFRLLYEFSYASPSEELNAETIIFSPDGKKLYVGAKYLSDTIIYDLQTGNELRRFSFYTTGDFLLSPEEDYIVNFAGDEIRFYNARAGVRAFVLSSQLDTISVVRYSPKGSYIITGHGAPFNARKRGFVTLWEAATGRMIRVIESTNFSMDINGLVFSHDESMYATASFQSVKVWDTSTGELIHNLKHNSSVTNILFTLNDNQLISTTGGEVIFWDLEKKIIINRIQSNTSHGAISLSPDGKYLATAWEQIKMWDVDKSELIGIFSLPEEKKAANHYTDILFSDDGKFLFTNIFGIVSAWDIESRKQIWEKSFRGNLFHSWDKDWGFDLSISPSGDRLLVAHSFRPLIEIKITTGELIRSIAEEEFPRVTAADYSPDGNHVVIASYAGRLAVIDHERNQVIFIALPTEDMGFISFTPDGYYFGTDIMMHKGVYIVDGLTTRSVDQYFLKYYRPDIITARLSGELEGIQDTHPRYLESKPPEVTIALENDFGSFRGLSIVEKAGLSNQIENDAIRKGNFRLKLTAHSSASAIKELRLYHNGTLISKSLDIAPQTEVSRIYSVRLVDGENNLKAVAMNEEGVESRPAIVLINYSSTNILKPNLWILSVGINDYLNSRYNLNYAVADSSAFAETVETVGSTLFQDVKVICLKDRDVTLESIKSAFRTIAQKAQPEDVFLFFYAGHGIALELPGSEGTEFFFIPSTITQMTDENQIREKALSGNVFQMLTTDIPARKQLLVLDACNAGALNSSFKVRGAAEEIALSRLSRSAGLALIAASRENQFAQEFKAIGQGALTKALIDGLSGGAVIEGGTITVASLKSYVESVMPNITEKYTGRSQWPTGFIFGQDFPIGFIGTKE